MEISIFRKQLVCIHLVLLFCVALAPNQGYSQDFIEYGTIEQIVSQNVPSLKIFYHKIGNLNRDSLPDLVAIYDYNRENANSDTESLDNPLDRTMLLYVGLPDGKLQLAKRNDRAVLCSNCGGQLGDPFDGITIKNGFFTLEFSGGTAFRWSRFVTFKYSKEERNWFLHRDGGETFTIHNPDIVNHYMETTADFGVISLDMFMID
jgi:hypothetical protein